MKFPKIETLWNRDIKTFGVIPGNFRCPEFKLINSWLITEKIDGTNIRVFLHSNGQVEFRGRTDKAQIPKFLIAKLESIFLEENLQSVFNRDEEGKWPEVILFGEGYGPKIQSGGKYRKDINFRLFDIRIGEWWLNWDDITKIAKGLNILTVPIFGIWNNFLPMCSGELSDMLLGGNSRVSIEESGNEILAEGIVARTDPLLFDRRGNRVMWKLKFKDFKESENDRNS